MFKIELCLSVYSNKPFKTKKHKSFERQLNFVYQFILTLKTKQKKRTSFKCQLFLQINRYIRVDFDAFLPSVFTRFSLLAASGALVYSEEF